MLLKVWKAGREERIVREVLVVVCRHVTVRAFSWVGILFLFLSYKFIGEAGVEVCLA